MEGSRKKNIRTQKFYKSGAISVYRKTPTGEMSRMKSEQQLPSLIRKDGILQSAGGTAQKKLNQEWNESIAEVRGHDKNILQTIHYHLMKATLSCTRFLLVALHDYLFRSIFINTRPAFQLNQTNGLSTDTGCQSALEASLACHRGKLTHTHTGNYNGLFNADLVRYTLQYLLIPFYVN